MATRLQLSRESTAEGGAQHEPDLRRSGSRILPTALVRRLPERFGAAAAAIQRYWSTLDVCGLSQQAGTGFPKGVFAVRRARPSQSTRVYGCPRDAVAPLVGQHALDAPAAYDLCCKGKLMLSDDCAAGCSCRRHAPLLLCGAAHAREAATPARLLHGVRTLACHSQTQLQRRACLRRRCSAVVLLSCIRSSPLTHCVCWWRQQVCCCYHHRNARTESASCCSCALHGRAVLIVDRVARCVHHQLHRGCSSNIANSPRSKQRGLLT